MIETSAERRGGDFVRTMALKAMQLSKDRADEVHKRLVERNPQVEKARLESIGRGWDEPVGTTPTRTGG
jgi:NitT/TauT family transport system substrate-binding protein